MGGMLTIRDKTHTNKYTNMRVSSIHSKLKLKSHGPHTRTKEQKTTETTAAAATTAAVSAAAAAAATTATTTVLTTTTTTIPTTATKITF